MHGNEFLGMMHIIGCPKSRRQLIRKAPKADLSLNIMVRKLLLYSNSTMEWIGLQRFSQTFAHHCGVVNNNLAPSVCQ